MASLFAPSVQSTNIDFQLHTLGWKSFQDLCATILRNNFAQSFQIFGSSNDAGKDGAFKGNWQPTPGDNLSGSFVAQCKHTTKGNTSLTLSVLSDELNKAILLADKGECENYIILTNYSLTGSNHGQIIQAFKSIAGINEVRILGKEWISDTIKESASLRMLVPRVYGLGDLSQIIDERAYQQALIILATMAGELAKFVVTDPYKKSVRAIREHGFVILLGEPAAGKTTIAASLSLGSVDSWGVRPIKISNAKEFNDHWNANDPNQLFWVDDVFGSTQYDRDLVHEWNLKIPAFQAALKKGAKAIFTSRDYIYRSAIQDFKTSAFPLIADSQVVIDVQKLSLREKSEILYNHIKLGDQPRTFRSQIKGLLPAAAKNPHFLPEIARRLGGRKFTSKLLLTETRIRKFVEEPVDFLTDTIKTLDTHSQAALAYIFIGGGTRPSPLEFSGLDRRALEMLDTNEGKLIKAMDSLKGSFLKFVNIEADPFWSFKHRTIGDAYAGLIAEDPNLLEIYLAGAKTERIMDEIICGNITFAGAKVKIPTKFFEEIINRLDDVTINRRKLLSFLSNKCGAVFLEKYIKAHPVFLDSISEPGTYLSSWPETGMISRLREFGLLPEENRERFVEGVRDLAVTMPDTDFLSHDYIRAIFRDEEIAKILKDLREKLIPNLKEKIQDWKSDYDTAEDPESYFAPLVDSLQVLLENFVGEEPIEKALDAGITEIEKVAGELQEDYAEANAEPYEDDEWGYEGRESDTERDIFDDVDK